MIEFLASLDYADLRTLGWMLAFAVPVSLVLGCTTQIPVRLYMEDESWSDLIAKALPRTIVAGIALAYYLSEKHFL